MVSGRTQQGGGKAMMNPFQIGLELTKACNYQCKHCFSSAGKPLAHELSFKEICDLMDESYDIGAIFVNLTGGEPILRPDLLEILEYTCHFGEAQIYHFQTNGTTWNRELLEQFLRVCQKQPSIDVQISLDGYDPTSYVRARGGPPENFNRMVEFVQALKANEVEVNSIMAVTNQTLPFAIKTARFAIQELGIEQFLIIPLFPAGRAVANFSELEFSRQAWRDLLVEITNLKKGQAWGGDIQRVEVGFFTLYDLVLPLEEAGLQKEIRSVWRFEEENFERDAKRPTMCESGYTDLVVNSEGLVFPCTPSIDSAFIAGSTRSDSLSSIWENSSCLQWFRYEATHVCEKEPCRSCDHKKVCGGGCRLTALSLTGERTNLDPRCPLVANYREEP
jgi:radical SAM protein with 4Fe4S-binding SPASM domain